MAEKKQTKSYKKLFIEIAESKGYKVKKPSFSERKGNVDFLLEGQKGGQSSEVRIDLKKKNGKNANHWVYIEYENSKGGKGWLYGMSDFVIFETSKEFIFIPRKGLIKFLNESQIVRWDLPYVDKPWNSKYRLFRRKNTLETITQIKVKDLLNIPNHQVWQKHSK